MLLSFRCLKNMTSGRIFICTKDLLWSVTFLQKVSSPTYLGCRGGRQENAGGEWRHPDTSVMWLQPKVDWALPAGPGDVLHRDNSTTFSAWLLACNLCLQPSTRHLAWRSSGWERIDLDISLYWSILRFTRAGKFFLCKQAELIEPVERASLNSFLLSSVSSSDAFWCATHLALSAGEVTKVKWRWEHFIHNFYELFRPTVSLPLGNICFLIAA